MADWTADADLYPIYYRLFRSYQDDKPCVVTMQAFDEIGYDQTRFINEEHYPTEEVATEALHHLQAMLTAPAVSAIEGWICPRCRRVWAPWVRQCEATHE